ncbi:MAG: hypothetical protein MUE85_16455 [Microscillaceae bacterium]|jgi:hypothetical protein|nr:hypothetical protein [Microscillaceae bacterium]
MAQQSFQFNGKTYQSLDELPEEFKVFFKDENNNGIPDIFENMQKYTQQGASEMNFNFTQYHVNGKTYDSLAEVPLEQQQMIKDKLAQVKFPPATNDNSSTNFSSNLPNLNPTFQSPRSGANYNAIMLAFLALAMILIGLALYFR